MTPYVYNIIMNVGSSYLQNHTKKHTLPKDTLDQVELY